MGTLTQSIDSCQLDITIAVPCGGVVTDSQDQVLPRGSSRVPIATHYPGNPGDKPCFPELGNFHIPNYNMPAFFASKAGVTPGQNGVLLKLLAQLRNITEVFSV